MAPIDPPSDAIGLAGLAVADPLLIVAGLSMPILRIVTAAAIS
ncbi:hypothetical protein [Agrobacterium vitis]|nr:hypothetical protein [Agrobacterium vitis]